MQPSELSEENVIDLLIGDITIGSLTATALAFPPVSLDIFLDKMRKITQGMIRFEKASVQFNKFNLFKDMSDGIKISSI